MSRLNILMVQMNTLVGDFEGNTARVIDAMRRAESQVSAPVLVFPELTLSGYPPEDLLLRPSIELRVNQSLQAIKAAMTGDSWLVLGYPRREGIALYNVAAVLHRGEIVAEYRKQCLPNYQVFDEMRYFQKGDSPCVVQIEGVRVGLTVCEDIWEPGPVREAARAGAQPQRLTLPPRQAHRALGSGGGSRTQQPVPHRLCEPGGRAGRAGV